MFGIDDMAMATGLAALANVGGGLISSGGQASANAQNVQMQNMINQQTLNAQQASHEQNTAFMEDSQAFSAQQQSIAQNFNMQEAEKNRSFQFDQAERTRQAQENFQATMANTAYQRAMADMKLAGLNPILAYQRGGAAVPGGSGAMASGATATSSGVSAGMGSAAGPPSLRAPTVQNEKDNLGRAVGNIASSALDTFKTMSGVNLVKEQEQTQRDTQKNLKATTDKTEAETGRVAVDADRTKAETENIRLQNRVIAAQGGLTESQAAVEAQRAKDAYTYGSDLTPQGYNAIVRRITHMIERGEITPDKIKEAIQDNMPNKPGASGAPPSSGSDFWGTSDKVKERARENREKYGR